MKNLIILFAISAIFMACGSSKSLQGDSVKKTETTADNTRQQSLDYIRKVSDNAVYSKNIVSKIDFEVNALGRNISLDGKLQMRRDEVIRITITPFGLMEAARLEFTPDYVLLIDRINKEYVKAKYSDIDFLKNNGLDFFTLQSMFWNELFIPGKKSLGDTDLNAFSTDMAKQTQRPVMLKTGKFDFTWNTDPSRALITNTTVNYGKGTSMASTMSFDYADFVPMGAKKFPSKETLTFNSKVVNSGKMSLTLLLGKIGNESNWEAQTAVSEKYKEVQAEDILRKLTNM